MSPTRRRLLAAVAGAASIAGCLTDPGPADSPGSTAPPSGSPDPTDTPVTTPTSTGTPVTAADCSLPEFSAVYDDPDPGRCPPMPADPQPCDAMEYALTLERHRRFAAALDRYDHVRELEFGVYAVEASPVDGGVRVDAELFFAGTTGEGSPVHFDDTYRAAFLVTDAGAWRSVDRTGDPATAPRETGTRVDCAGGTPATA